MGGADYSSAYDVGDWDPVDTYNFDSFDSFDSSAGSSLVDNYNYSDYFSDVVDTYNTDYFDPNTYIDLSGSLGGDYVNDLIDTSYGNTDLGYDYLDSVNTGLNVSDMFNYLDGIDINSGNFDDYNASQQFIAQDISNLDQGELDLLKGLGQVDINEDGFVSGFDSRNAIQAIENRLIEDRDNLSDSEIAELTSLRNEMLAAEDMGLKEYGLDIPIGATPYTGSDGKEYYTNPDFVEGPSTALAGEGGKVPMLGTQLANDIRFAGAEGYEADPVTMGKNNYQLMKSAMAFPGQNLSAIDGSRAAANTQSYINSGGKFDYMGQPEISPSMYGMPMQVRVDQSVPGSIVQGVDTMTDYMRDGAGMLLKPVNWVTDAIGGGINFIGDAIGDNVVGRGFNSFGNIIDNTGDYLFGSGDRDSLLGTVFNVPDSLTEIGVGGLSGNWDLAKQGLKGLISAPVELIGNTLSLPAAVATDVFGINDYRLGTKGGGSGSAKAKSSSPKRKSPERQRIGNVKNQNKGNSREGIGIGDQLGGDQVVTYDGKDYDLSTADGQSELLSDSDTSTLMDGLAEVNGTNLLSDDQIRALANLGPGAGSDSSASMIQTSDVDRSDIGKAFAEKQGGESNVKVKKSPTIEDIENVINKKAGGSVMNTQSKPVKSSVSLDEENLDFDGGEATSFR